MAEREIKNIWYEEPAQNYWRIRHEPKKNQITGAALQYLMKFIVDSEIFNKNYKENK